MLNKKQANVLKFYFDNQELIYSEELDKNKFDKSIVLWLCDMGYIKAHPAGDDVFYYTSIEPKGRLAYNEHLNRPGVFSKLFDNVKQVVVFLVGNAIVAALTVLITLWITNSVG